MICVYIISIIHIILHPLNLKINKNTWITLNHAIFLLENRFYCYTGLETSNAVWGNTPDKVTPFLVVTIPQSLMVKLQPRFAVSIAFFLKYGIKCLKIKQSHPVLWYIGIVMNFHSCFSWKWHLTQKTSLKIEKDL